MNPEVLDMDCTNEKISESLLLLILLKNIKIYTKQPIRMEITQRFSKETSQKLILRTEDYFGTSITFKESPQIQHFFQKTKLLTFRLYKNNQLVSQIKDVNLTKIVKNNLGELVFKDNNNVDFAWLNLRCEVLLSKDIFKVSVGIKFDKKQLHSQDSIAEYKIVRGQKQKNQQIEVLSSTSYNQLNNDNCFICEEKQVLGAKLCRNNYESLTIKIFHRSSSNQSIKAIWMGSVSFSVEETQVKKQKQFLYSSGIKVGTVWIACQHIQYKKGFLSHLKNGLDIMSVLCIDFTSSNLQYIDEKSKHFFASDKLSDYEQVLETSIEQIMECDKDKHIPTFGFGSIVNHPNYFTNGKVSHRFPLSMDQNKANFSSLDEIRKAYRENMKYLKFAGPTYMAFLMKWAIQECKKILSSEDNYKYMILFILTDGQFCDEEEMRDLIVECSHLPISTVFIGIGDEDFTILEELDDDDAKLVDRNENPTVRDSVQFVPFEKYKNNLLAFKKEVLAEIPRQIEEYFYFKSKKQQ